MLIVGGATSSAESIATFLSGRGVSVITAPDWPSAWQLYKAEQPALVIADENLPVVSGSQLLRLLRRKYRSAVGPAILMAGSAAAVSRPESDFVLEEPVDVETLSAIAETLLALAGARGAR